MNFSEWEKKMLKITERPRDYGITNCIVCDREFIHMVGVCFPYEKMAKQLRQPKGKMRSVIYGLCKECALEPNVSDKIDAQIFKDLDDKGEDAFFLIK